MRYTSLSDELDLKRDVVGERCVTIRLTDWRKEEVSFNCSCRSGISRDDGILYVALLIEREKSRDRKEFRPRIFRVHQMKGDEKRK